MSYFDLPWLRKISQKSPALARFLELCLYSVMTLFLMMASSLADQLLANVRDGTPIDWHAVLSINLTAVLVPLLISIQAAIGKARRDFSDRTPQLQPQPEIAPETPLA